MQSRSAIDSLVKTGPNLFSTLQSPSAGSGTSKQGSQFDGYSAVKARMAPSGDQQANGVMIQGSPAKGQFQHSNTTWGQPPPGNPDFTEPGDQGRKSWRATPPPSAVSSWGGPNQPSYGSQGGW